MSVYRVSIVTECLLFQCNCGTELINGCLPVFFLGVFAGQWYR